MAQGRLEVGGRVTGQDELADALGLPATALVDPAGLVASTGVPHLLVHVRSRQAVDEASPDEPGGRGPFVDLFGCGFAVDERGVDPSDRRHPVLRRPVMGLAHVGSPACSVTLVKADSRVVASRSPASWPSSRPAVISSAAACMTL